MVRKIGDKPGAAGTSSIQSTRSIESTKIGEVEQVKAADSRSGVGAVRRSTRQLTPEQQQELLAMINEEADRMFDEGTLPRSKKDTVKGAVRMAIEASMVEEEETKKKK
ncbi:MAG TPA: hypothetical protein PLP17_04345 [Oligoflexia bacterium]|nr:hypothetical protein [Oligoflexia bacterium]